MAGISVTINESCCVYLSSYVDRPFARFKINRFRDSCYQESYPADYVPVGFVSDGIGHDVDFDAGGAQSRDD